MDGARRMIGRCLVLGGILLVTLVVSAGLLAVFSSAGDRAVETVMKVIAALSLLGILVDGVVLLVALGLVATDRDGES